MVPISTTRLKAVLDWLDADNEKKPAEALVFSDETGRADRPIPNGMGDGGAQGARREAGMEVVQLDGAHAGWQQEFKRINLHWHDMRHDYDRSQVRDLLN